MECLRVARALLLSTIPLTAWAQTPRPIPIETALPPFQFLQKPGPNPVGLRVVNQYDPSRKSPVLAGDHSKPAESDKDRPLQTLIWYPALPSGAKSMKVGDYVTLADTEISFGVPDQEHNKWRTRLKSSFDVPLGQCAMQKWRRDTTQFSFTLPAIHPLHGKTPICASTLPAMAMSFLPVHRWECQREI